MPALAEYPYDSPQDLVDLAQGEAQERRAMIERQWRYYNGDHRKPFKIRPGQPSDNVVINLARQVVDQSVSFMMGESLSLHLVPAEEMPDETIDAKQALLDTIWEMNSGNQYAHNLIMGGSLAGHCFVKVTPDPQRIVRLAIINPRQVSVYWHPDDMEQIIAYKIQWLARDEHQRQDWVSQGNSWLVRDLVKENKRQDWQIKGETIWPYPWPAIVDWQNLPEPEEYYGRPDLGTPELNDTINFLASNILRIIRYHAHPRTIATGTSSQQVLDTSVDNLWTIASPDARIYNLEMQSDLGSSMEMLRSMTATFFAQHRAVDVSGVKDRVGQLTNFGIRVLFNDAIDKASTKCRLYEHGLNEAMVRAMVLAGQPVDKIDVRWGSLLPVNEKEQIEVLQAELGLGILSKATASEIRGRNWETEQERLADEQAVSGSIGEMILRRFDAGV